MGTGHVLRLAGVALLVLVANVAASIGYMVVYSYVINPGHNEQFYRDHITVAAPYCSIVAGIPLMFLAGWWAAGWSSTQHAVQAAVIIWLVYALIDGAVLVASGMTARIAALFAVSMLTKLAAVYGGALVGRGGRGA